MALPPASKYWTTTHGVKLRKPTSSYPYYRLDYQLGGRRRLTSAGTDETAAWEEACRMDALVAAATGSAAELSCAAMAQAWVDECREAWAPRYLEETEHMLSKQVLPVIGDLQVGALRREHLVDVLAGTTCRSNETQVRALLSSWLGWAEDEWLSRSRKKLLPKAARKVAAVRFIEFDEAPDTAAVMALYRAMLARRGTVARRTNNQARYETEAYMALTAAFTGIRQGELFALRGKDLAGDVLIVDEQIQVVGGRPMSGLLPKGHKSRKVIVPVEVEGVQLLSWLQARAEQVGPDGLMFPTPTGKPWRRNNFTRQVLNPSRQVAWAGKTWTWHSLRHHYCRWLLEQGVDPKDVSLMAGHSSVRVTLDMYIGHTLSAFERVRNAVTADTSRNTSSAS